MNETVFVLIPIFLPILAGIGLLIVPEYKNRKTLIGVVSTALILTGILVFISVFQTDMSLTFFYLTKTLPIYFKLDLLGKLFVSIVTIVWILAGIFSFEYMKHETHEKRYFGF